MCGVCLAGIMAHTIVMDYEPSKKAFAEPILNFFILL